jgi:hypothetical protein
LCPPTELEAEPINAWNMDELDNMPIVGGVSRRALVEKQHQDAVGALELAYKAELKVEKEKGLAQLQNFRKVEFKPEEYPLGSDPLPWWAANHHLYPYLSPLARRDLAVFGSQAAVERIFSAAGRICNKMRSSLKPRSLERLLKLLVNYHLIPVKAP